MVLPTRNTHDAVKAADSDELLLLERLRGALLVVCPTAVSLPSVVHICKDDSIARISWS
jgi:hypothetical protein